ncbi:MAG: hypothetical protein QM754_02965 [Tepidisphaeraceae bacterium]
MQRKELSQRLPAVVQSLVDDINSLPTTRRLGDVLLPSREKVIAIIDGLQQLAFPGYFGLAGVNSSTLPFRIGELVMELTDLLLDQVSCCLRYREGRTPGDNAECQDCDRLAADIVATFFERLPTVRQMLASDVQAAFDGDPAATTPDEIIFCYPGLYAIMVQRLAHELLKLGVPLLPRMMTERASSLTGIEIHPGAVLGRSFMIDHGTGVVIGETTVIGNNVKVYQGVTLGLAPAYGQALRGQKRHPTIEDDVVIYAGATILGGDTVIGAGCVIGGNVFLTTSVPPKNQVLLETPKLKYRDRRPKSERVDTIDFQI